MKPAPHWPLHPAPREGEALSSWLNRVALCYHMEVSELLEHDLGHGQVDDLDTAPPLALLAAMGAPLRPRPRLPEMEQLALALLRKVGVRMLVIDELHNVLAGNSVNRREFLNLLRFLGNELRIPLVGVGTREAYLAIRSDDQLENRFEPMLLPPWEANEDCCSLLASFAASLPLRRPSPIATLDMARYLLTRSEGTIGELAHLLVAAAVAAVESGEEAINHRTLSMADYIGPSERRRQFERELM